MKHFFDTDIAVKYGIEEALVYDYLEIATKTGEAGYFEGKWWIPCSAKSLHEIFPYMNARKIQRILTNLVEFNLIKKGCFNKHKYDKTLWYSLVDEGGKK